MPVAAAFVAGGAALTGAGINAWMQYYGMKEARKESRRSEALQIKLAGEESEREESRFTRNFGLQERQLAASEKAQAENLGLEKRKVRGQESQSRVNNTQAILSNIMNLMGSNREQAMRIMQFNRGRQ